MSSNFVNVAPLFDLFSTLRDDCLQALWQDPVLALQRRRLKDQRVLCLRPV